MGLGSSDVKCLGAALTPLVKVWTGDRLFRRPRGPGQSEGCKGLQVDRLKPIPDGSLTGHTKRNDVTLIVA